MKQAVYAEIPKDAKKLEGRNELAFGEVTGHAHRTLVGDLFETKNGQLFLKNDKLDQISHEEHKNIALEPGIRHVCIKRQYAEGSWENVRD